MPDILIVDRPGSARTRPGGPRQQNMGGEILANRSRRLIEFGLKTAEAE